MDTNKANETLLSNLSSVRGTIAKTCGVRSGHLTDEIIGDFVIHALTRVIPQWDPSKDSSAKSWLCNAAKNFCINQLSLHANAKRHESQDETTEDSDGSPLTGRELSSQLPNPLDALLRAEQEIRLVRALGTLPREDSQLLAVESMVGGKGAATVLDTSAPTVSRRKKALWASLRSKLDSDDE